MIERENADLSLTAQAELFSLSRASLYYQPLPPPPEEVAIKHRIDEIYTAYPFYGSRKITVELQPDFNPINRKRVQRYMREMGISAICPGPNLSKRQADQRVYPYLLRGVTVQAPNHVWGTDITYVRLRSSWMYLVAVLDWYSRYVVSWALDDTLEIGFVLEAMSEALSRARPQICNSDQGSHFTSPQYTTLLEAAGVRISMDGKGRALDNIFTERLWRSLKYEEIYLHEYANPREARIGIHDYLQFYNDRRVHQALDYRRPTRQVSSISYVQEGGNAPKTA